MEPVTDRLDSLEPLARPGTPLGDLAARLREAGHQAYVVGGSVRDALLGAPSSDLDVTTDARPEQIRSVVDGWADAVWLQGERFGTVGVVRGGVAIEITTFRADVYRADSRKPTVTYSDSIEADLARRDFTVNAIAAELPSLQLVDVFQGRADLEAKLLRTPQSADVSFTDDPLRMLRAARFVSTYGLTAVPEVIDAMRRHRNRLAIVSAERIHGELLKLICAEDPEPGFRLLAGTGVLAEFLPEPVRVSELRRVRAEELPRFTVLFADTDPRQARHRLHALRGSASTIAGVTRLLTLMQRAQAAVNAGHLSRPTLRELALAAGSDLSTLLEVLRALDRVAPIATAIEELGATESLDGPDSSFDGTAVMAYLGLESGRAVGDALKALREARIQRGPLDDDAAREVLDAWARDR